MRAKTLYKIRNGDHDQLSIERVVVAGSTSCFRLVNSRPNNGKNAGPVEFGAVTWTPEAVDDLANAFAELQRTYGRHQGVPGPGQEQLDL